MKNLQIQCESPAIILNPHLKDLILKYRHYYINDWSHELSSYQVIHWFDEFPYSMFNKIKSSLQCMDEIDRYYILDEYGDKIPLFYQVPCGKCILCKEHKCQEWVSRAMCETQSSCNIPYFITLTYNNLHIPQHGVSKYDAQLFMKRFRINIERYVHHEVNLRFFLCAEYGSKTKRPHYHALVWNIPTEIQKKDILLDILEQSWSYMVNKDTFHHMPNDVDKYHMPIYKFYDKANKRYRVRYGFVHCSECNEHRVRYAMKYMRKDSTVPANCEDTFFLSSRRRGLGYQWICEHVQEFRENPQLMDIVLTDKFTGEKYQGCLPRYFKDIIAPPPSKLIKKEIRDMFKYYNWLRNKACSLIGHMHTPSDRLLNHYPTLYYHHSRLPNEVNNNLKLYEGLNNTTNYDCYTRDLWRKVDELENILLSYEYDIPLSLSTPIYKKQHQSAVEVFLQSQNFVSIEDKVYRINRRNRIARECEIL